MSILTKVYKAEYIFKPSQLLKRAMKRGLNDNRSLMPWGYHLNYNHDEGLGKALNTLGIYDLPLTELIYRSLRHVEHFVDVGANIGYFSSLACAHPNIRSVISLEPHPELFAKLEGNLQETHGKAKVLNTAASDYKGQANLYVPKGFENNMGIASLEANPASDHKIQVELNTLDEILDADKEYVIKIDTEGHEAQVLRGASEVLSSSRAPLVFFEEFDDFPSAESFEILHNNRYKIYIIQRALTRPKLSDPNAQLERRWEPTNYVAVKFDAFDISKLDHPGWEILKL